MLNDEKAENHKHIRMKKLMMNKLKFMKMENTNMLRMLRMIKIANV